MLLLFELPCKGFLGVKGQEEMPVAHVVGLPVRHFTSVVLFLILFEVPTSFFLSVRGHTRYPFPLKLVSRSLHVCVLQYENTESKSRLTSAVSEPLLFLVDTWDAASCLNLRVL